MWWEVWLFLASWLKWVQISLSSCCSHCATAAVAVGGLSFQSRCNLAALGQRRGLRLLITATVMKCWQLISRDNSAGMPGPPSALLRTWMLSVSTSMQLDCVLFSLPLWLFQYLSSLTFFIIPGFNLHCFHLYCFLLFCTFFSLLLSPFSRDFFETTMFLLRVFLLHFSICLSSCLTCSFSS